MRYLLLLAVAGCSFQHGAASRADGSTDTDTDTPLDIDAMPDAATPAPFAMSGLHWQLPCVTAGANYNCTCAGTPLVDTVTLTGDASQHWRVTVRIRGAMEAITYTGGNAGASGWYVNGNPGDGADNVYKLTVSSPSAHYFLNRGTPTSQRSFAYDYMATFPVDGNAVLTYESNGQDGIQWGNHDAAHNPITFPGVVTAPDPYDGQFAQLDVVDATPI